MRSIICVFSLFYALNVCAMDSEEWKLIFKAATGGMIKEKYIFDYQLLTIIMVVIEVIIITVCTELLHGIVAEEQK